jgi:peptidoglycan/LPS O-acetylase OafA/YrhL
MRGDWSDWPGLGRIVASVLLLPLPEQVMMVAWTLTVEGLFYLVFAATFFSFGRVGAITALGVWALVAQALLFLPNKLSPSLGLVFYSGVVEFLYGALIALTVASARNRWAKSSLVVGALALAVVVTGIYPIPWGREWVAGLPSALLVYGLAAGAWRVPDWAMVWGEASYLLYLLHLLVFSVAGTLMRMFGIKPYGSVYSMIGLGALALLVSVVTTLQVERPSRRWTRKR